MALNWNGSNISVIKYNNNNVTAVYWGSTKVWPEGPFASLTDYYTGFYGTDSNGTSFSGFYGVHSGNSSSQGTVRTQSSSVDITAPVNSYATCINNGSSIVITAKGDSRSNGAHGSFAAITSIPFDLTGKTSLNLTYTLTNSSSSSGSGITIIRGYYSSSNSVSYTNAKSGGAGFSFGSQLCYKSSAATSTSKTISMSFSGKTGKFYLGFMEICTVAAATFTITNLTLS